MKASGRFGRDQAGATTIEYAVIGCLFSIVIIGAVAMLGGQTDAMFEYVRDALIGAEEE